MRLLPVALATISALAACGGRIGGAEEPVKGAGPGSSDCASIVAHYSPASLGAMACDPAAVDACGVQYPLAVKSCDSSMHCAFERLCWVAYVGYVNPARTNELDRLLQQYRGAGCVISSCPGPAPHDTRCVQNTAGAFTCGGF